MRLPALHGVDRPISTGVATLSWIVLEKPFIAWRGKRLTAPASWLKQRPRTVWPKFWARIKPP